METGAEAVSVEAQEGEKGMEKERELADAEESRGGHLLQSYLKKCFVLFEENTGNKFVIQEEVENASAPLGGVFLSSAPHCAISAPLFL